MNRIKVIDENEIREVLTFENLSTAVESSLISFSKGPAHPLGAVQPLRSTVRIPEHNGVLLVMPGYLRSEGALVTKILTQFSSNADKGIPIISSVITLMDAETGQFIALLDGTLITELRTAASSYLASKLCAPENVTKVAVLGSGRQAFSHARIHHHFYHPQEVSVWSRQKKNAESLAEILRSENIPVMVASTPEEAVKDADIINTCTLGSAEPILWEKHVKDGAHINAVGAHGPDRRELDTALMKKAVVYTDTRQGAMTESGDVILSEADVFAEIGEVLNGEKPAFRQKTTIYKSLGLAVLDAAAARLTYDLLTKQE